MEIGPKQKKVVDKIAQVFYNLEIFKKIMWYFDDKEYKIMLYVMPVVVYEDMVIDVPDEEIKDFGFVCPLPAEEDIRDEAFLNYKSTEIVKSLLAAYISGNDNRVIKIVNSTNKEEN